MEEAKTALADFHASVPCPRQLGIWRCWFLQREKTAEPGRKNLWSKQMANNKPNTRH